MLTRVLRERRGQDKKIKKKVLWGKLQQQLAMVGEEQHPHCEKHIVASGLWLQNKTIYIIMSTLELGDIGIEGPIIILVYTAHRRTITEAP